MKKNIKTIIELLQGIMTFINSIHELNFCNDRKYLLIPKLQETQTIYTVIMVFHG